MLTAELTGVSLERQSRSVPRIAFAGVWAIGILLFGGVILSGNTGPDKPLVVGLGLVFGLLLAGTLVWWLPGASFAGLPFHTSPSMWRGADERVVEEVVAGAKTIAFS